MVRNRASTLSSAAPSWAQPKGRVASPSLPTASGTKGTQTDESRADAIREALVRLDAIEQTRAAAPRLTAEGLEREALEEIGREFGLDSQQTRTAYTARKALEEDLDRITNPRPALWKRTGGGDGRWGGYRYHHRPGGARGHAKRRPGGGGAGGACPGWARYHDPAALSGDNAGSDARKHSCSHSERRERPCGGWPDPAGAKS